MSDDIVVSLRGSPIKPPGEPIADVVKLLEETLEMARVGEVQGVAVVRTHADRSTSYFISGKRDRGTLGCIELVKAVFLEELLDAE